MKAHLHDELLDLQLVVKWEVHELVRLVRRDLAARNDPRFLQPAFLSAPPPSSKERHDSQQHQRFPLPRIAHPKTSDLPARSLQLHLLPIVPLPLPKPVLLPPIRSPSLRRIPKDVEALEERREGDPKGRFGGFVGWRVWAGRGGSREGEVEFVGCEGGRTEVGVGWGGVSWCGGRERTDGPWMERPSSTVSLIP